MMKEEIKVNVKNEGEEMAKEMKKEVRTIVEVEERKEEKKMEKLVIFNNNGEEIEIKAPAEKDVKIITLLEEAGNNALLIITKDNRDYMFRSSKAQGELCYITTLYKKEEISWYYEDHRVLPKNFINVSNHKSAGWSKEQTTVAESMVDGGIIDLSFPAVSAVATTSEVAQMATDLVENIMELNPGVVMCQGEMTLVFEVVRLLKEGGVKTVAACSNRETVETQDAEGHTVKTAVFRFEQFREY